MVVQVSAIIPAWNSSHCIARAINSAITQNGSSVEVIVVNDGSTDGTREICQSFGSLIKYIEQPNLGPAAARNAGVRLAQGEYIAFLDADDFWLPGFLDSCVRFLEQNTEAAAVSTGLRILRLDGKVWEGPSALLNGPHKHPYIIEDFFSFWAKHDHIRTGSCIIRKSAFHATGGQREDLLISEDLEFWAMLGTVGPWGFIPSIFWVCDSERMAAHTGWLKKYHRRRKECPTVDQFQARILPRLTQSEISSFKIIRGRIALNFAQNHILAGRAGMARKIVLDYGDEMPSLWSAWLMRIGSRIGSIAWAAACTLVKARELQKSAVMKYWPPQIS